MLEKSLAININLVGENNPSTATCYNNIAEVIAFFFIADNEKRSINKTATMKRLCNCTRKH